MIEKWCYLLMHAKRKDTGYVDNRPVRMFTSAMQAHAARFEMDEPLKESPDEWFYVIAVPYV